MLANCLRRVVFFAVSLLFTVVIPSQSAISQPIQVSLDIDSFTHDADSYLLEGSTNLPPKTRLWIRITMDGYDGPNWDICVLAEVTDKGRIEAAISAPLGRPKTGPHTVEVVVPINSDSGFTEVFKAFQRASTMSSQSDAILAIVGEKGEQLQGPLVHRHAEGVPQMITAWSVWVETSAQFDVRDRRGKTDAEVAKREKGL